MTINIFEAERLIDDVLDQADIDFLLAARQGVALHDTEDTHMKVMREHNLIDVLPFDHPRASNAIYGVVPNENGVKLLNVLDDRKRAEDDRAIYAEPATDTQSESVVNAQDLSKDEAPGKGIPADDPRNRMEVVSDDERADQQERFATGGRSTKASKARREAAEEKSEVNPTDRPKND